MHVTREGTMSLRETLIGILTSDQLFFYNSMFFFLGIKCQRLNLRRSLSTRKINMFDERVNRIMKIEISFTFIAINEKVNTVSRNNQNRVSDVVCI